MKACELIVLPSLWEGLPITVLEAIVARLLVVATAVDGIRAVIRDGVTGFLVVPADSAALADSMVWLLSDPLAARRVGDSARGIV